MKEFFLPTQQNSYSPYFTRSKSIIVFALFVFAFNFLFGRVLSTPVEAAININNVVTLHNQERVSRGLESLKVNTLLNNSAQAKANAMLAADCWDHYCPNGKSPWAFFDEAGYTYIYAGENLAEGFSSDNALMQAWVNSKTHRDNILKPEFREIGIGIAQGYFQGRANNTVVTVHFGTRSTQNAQEVIKPQPTIKPVTPGKPIITSPLEGSIINNNRIDINGKAENSNKFEIFNNGDKIGQGSVLDGIFTYRPESDLPEGEQSITVRSSNNNQNSGLSDVRRFTVDTIKPKIVDNTIKALAASIGPESAITFNLETTEKVKSLSLRIFDEDYSFVEKIPNTWESDIAIKNLIKGVNLNFTLLDFAENSEQLVKSTDDVHGLDEMLEKVTQYSFVSKPQNSIVENIFSNISHADLKVKINLILILFTVTILLADIYALKKQDITGLKGKSHLHITNFIILLLVLVIGGLGGSIISGLNI